MILPAVSLHYAAGYISHHLEWVAIYNGELGADKLQLFADVLRTAHVSPPEMS